jgi:hypothetical protein
METLQFLSTMLSVVSVVTASLIMLLMSQDDRSLGCTVGSGSDKSRINEALIPYPTEAQ